MPESGEGFAFYLKIKRAIEEEKQKTGKHPNGRLQIYSSTFAIGTRDRAWGSITVDTSEYNESLEPLDPSFTPNPHDLVRAKRGVVSDDCRYLVEKPLVPGPLHVAVRGKAVYLAGGYHGLAIHFGLESSVIILTPAELAEITANSIPGTNSSKGKAKKLRSFVLPSRFIVEGSDQTVKKTKDGQKYLEPIPKQRTVNIMAAFVTDHFAVAICDFARLARFHVTSLGRMWTAEDLAVGSEMWPRLWAPFPDGPDWVLERPQAEAALAKWQESVLSRGSDQLIVDAICDNSNMAFGGFGRHLANDFLYTVAIHPGLSSYYVCSDPSMWTRLRDGIAPYMEQWRSDKFIRQCVTTPNSDNPFAFNYNSNTNYLKTWTKVMNKKWVNVPLHLYNLYVSQGYLDPNHVIGTPYLSTQPSQLQANPRGFKVVPVRQYRNGSTEFWTIITARPPDGEYWSLSTNYIKDYQTKGKQTTLGPASFRETISNVVVPEVKRLMGAKKGRPRKIRTGKPGRPVSTSQNKLQHFPKRLLANKENREPTSRAMLEHGVEQVIGNLTSPRKTRSRVARNN
ncbi:hypothetical protein CC2G_009690 [Coprinopsis cinerea AmutBmut pab1-1]|nr:hypothetical protein CC2G_009690 [Coprinopsis cinerea AmutBmut pab1-1]